MLIGKRIVLRAIEREDLPHSWAFNNDVEVEVAGGGDPPFPQSLARLQAQFEADLGRDGRDGMGFAIEADGKLIGQCGLFREDTTAHTCEMGITIGDKAYWGKEYGREAIGLLLAYAFEQRNFRKVWLRVNGRNERAQRAYRACGFIEEGRLRQHVWSDGAYDDLVYMGVLREEWKQTADD